MNELLQAVAPFLQAGGPGSAGGGSGGSGGSSFDLGILSEGDDEEVVQPNPRPAFNYALPEPDLNSVRQVLKNRLILKRRGNIHSLVKDYEVEQLIAVKGQIVARMYELDGPFWQRHRHRIIRDFLQTRQGGEYKVSLLRRKLQSLFEEDRGSAFYNQLIKMRESFYEEAPFCGPRGD